METAYTIANRINSFFQNLDEGQWKTAQESLFDPVYLEDALCGAEPAGQTSPQLAMDRMKAFLTRFDASLHYISNIIVESQEQKACARLYSTRTYHKTGASPPGFLKIYGIYEMSLVNSGGQWQIDFLKFSERFREGSSALLDLEPDAE
ncbi:nuclear transport factor 2 family protein [Pseudovibrio exalbescens]|uniref:nuclear transport factor 2 family protein n=1 Tax=Pseudovibrio exalbescens TaxID=197461 RepID=UPI000C9ACD53|nr:nuclear transport factor 2 family protein [Pseudovibrio exalbescens]